MVWHDSNSESTGRWQNGRFDCEWWAREFGSPPQECEKCPVVLPHRIGFFTPLYPTRPCTSTLPAQGLGTEYQPFHLLGILFPPNICRCHSLSSCGSLLSHHQHCEAISEHALQACSNPHTCTPYLPLFFSIVFTLVCLFAMDLLHKNVSSVKAGTSFYLLLNIQHLQCISHSGNSINI